MLNITISKRAAIIIAVALLLVIPGIAGATHIFTDVVDGSTHSPGIEWVADNGVSTGCGDGSTYCPNESVSRAQMGTFMCRLSGNCGVAPSVDAATAVTATDADTVGGYSASDLAGAITYWFSDSPMTVTSGTLQALGTIDFSAPTDGSVHVTGQSSFYEATEDVFMTMWLQLDNAVCTSGDPQTSISRGYEFMAGASADDLDQINLAGATNVTSGAHTMTLCAWDYSGGTGDPDAYSNGMTITFSPQSIVVATPLGGRETVQLPGLGS